jgi:hypothetical protein
MADAELAELLEDQVRPIPYIRGYNGTVPGIV